MPQLSLCFYIQKENIIFYDYLIMFFMIGVIKWSGLSVLGGDKRNNEFCFSTFGFYFLFPKKKYPWLSSIREPREKNLQEKIHYASTWFHCGKGSLSEEACAYSSGVHRQASSSSVICSTSISWPIITSSFMRSPYSFTNGFWWACGFQCKQGAQCARARAY